MLFTYPFYQQNLQFIYFLHVQCAFLYFKYTYIGTKYKKERTHNIWYNKVLSSQVNILLFPQSKIHYKSKKLSISQVEKFSISYQHNTLS